MLDPTADGKMAKAGLIKSRKTDSAQGSANNGDTLMATKVHRVNKCRVTNSAVERGEPYFWWKFPMGEKQYSATYPTRSQLTQSDYLACVFELVDGMDAFDYIDNADDFEDMLSEITEAIQDIQEQSQANYDNMAPMLHAAPNGRLLEARLKVIEEVLGDLDGAIFESYQIDDGLMDVERISAILKKLEITRRGKVIEAY